jgi:uncharacterized membrane protein YhaH (DUF805 family)
MTMTEAVRTCLSKYATFSGRAGRPEFWWWVLAVILVSLVGNLLDAMLFGTGAEGQSVGILSGLLGLALILPQLAVAARRLHDTDRTAWWLLIGLVPIVGFLVLLFFYVQKGTDGPNRFG